MRVTATVFLFVFLCAGAAAGANYYIDSELGNDRSGGHSAEMPWKSISKISLIKLQPGDTVFLKRGSEWQQQVTISYSGFQNRPAVITAYGEGNKPLINGGNRLLYGFLIINSTGLVISDINIDRAIHSGIRIKDSKFITIQNSEFFVEGRSGIFVEQSRSCSLIENNISTPPKVIGGQTDGIYLQRNSYCIIDGNRISIKNENREEHSDGVQSFQDTSITVRNNYIEQINNKSGNAQGIYATNAAGTHLYYNNIVYAPNTKASLIGFRNLDKGTGTVVVVNNTLKGKTSNKVYITEDPRAVIKNNILYSTGSSYSIRITSPLVDPSNLDYNLYYDEDRGLAVNYNGKNYNVEEARKFGMEKNGLHADPRLDDNFFPLRDSPAINSGEALTGYFKSDKRGIKRPKGRRFDIGAYEFSN